MTPKEKSQSRSYLGNGQRAYHQPPGTCLLCKYISSLLVRQSPPPIAHLLLLVGQKDASKSDFGAGDGRHDVSARAGLGIDQRAHDRSPNPQIPVPGRSCAAVVHHIENRTHCPAGRTASRLIEILRWVCDFHDEQPVANPTLEAHDQFRAQFQQGKHKTFHQMHHATPPLKRHPNTPWTKPLPRQPKSETTITITSATRITAAPTTVTVVHEAWLTARVTLAATTRRRPPKITRNVAFHAWRPYGYCSARKSQIHIIHPH